MPSPRAGGARARWRLCRRTPERVTARIPQHACMHGGPGPDVRGRGRRRKHPQAHAQAVRAAERDGSGRAWFGPAALDLGAPGPWVGPWGRGGATTSTGPSVPIPVGRGVALVHPTMHELMKRARERTYARVRARVFPANGASTQPLGDPPHMRPGRFRSCCQCRRGLTAGWLAGWLAPLLNPARPTRERRSIGPMRARHVRCGALDTLEWWYARSSPTSSHCTDRLRALQALSSFGAAKTSIGH